MPEINKQRAPLVHLSNSIAGLSEAASRVGQYILGNPEKVVRQTVAELAGFACADNWGLMVLVISSWL